MKNYGRSCICWAGRSAKIYSDIDLDANDMETELQAAFEEILWFVNAHLANTGRGNFENEDV